MRRLDAVSAQSYPQIARLGPKVLVNQGLGALSSGDVETVTGADTFGRVLLPVVVETPRHVALGDRLSYLSERPLAPGTLLRVPLGRRTVPGMVWDGKPEPLPEGSALRSVAEVVAALPPLPEDWRALVAFAASYYQRSLGEMALAVLPPELRKLDAAALLCLPIALLRRTAEVAIKLILGARKTGSER